MVLFPREMVGQFIDFITSVYKSEVIHQKNGEELARFMCQSRLFVIRNLEEDTDGTSPTVEIWANDAEVLKQIETRWEETLKLAFEEYAEMFEEEDDAEPTE